MQYVQDGEVNPARRRFEFDVRLASDGLSVAPNEQNGQPQISVNDAGWTAAGIGTLVAKGNGRYYAEVTPETLVAGDRITARYKSALTVETPCREDMMIVAFDPFDIAASIDLRLADSHGGGDWTGANKLVGTAPGDVVAPIGEPIGHFVGTYFRREFIITGGDYADGVWTAATFAIKRNADTDDDSAALILIRITNPAAGGDGLQRLNGNAAPNAAGATLAVAPSGGTSPGLSFVATINASSFQIPPSDEPYQYEIKRWRGAEDVAVAARGEFNAQRTVYRSAAP